MNEKEVGVFLAGMCLFEDIPSYGANADTGGTGASSISACIKRINNKYRVVIGKLYPKEFESREDAEVAVSRLKGGLI